MAGLHGTTDDICAAGTHQLRSAMGAGERITGYVAVVETDGPAGRRVHVLTPGAQHPGVFVDLIDDGATVLLGSALPRSA